MPVEIKKDITVICDFDGKVFSKTFPNNTKGNNESVKLLKSFVVIGEILGLRVEAKII